mmetsp:Transcript_19259/g.28493  ORF Transcript_19259/g.28493 Transcript_19259/m.28493 type:complete len:125 (-) Transcript_19259:61-435(-)|eukprot:CAMPEP_0194212024 /NCGR_PEP_ID=MMETSP0156-20130528/11548_1 /TAXON_ID=33649 /ORGANISM="Thalassionema nitzschioides, Strain L26-B" /LENGTH=124 /DNA_ID=CAMNT_0038939735 /DNA_START=70 /DNA_END=444 /DNA_ORIENTATION=+
MAKSIRSKIKRKHRAEFRRTIGTEAYNKSMNEVQSKLKAVVTSGSMKSFDRIADMLDTDGDMVKEVTAPPSNVRDDAEFLKGENKAPTKRGKSRKHKLRSKRTSPVAEKKKSTERPKPKYFCEF